MFDVCVVGSANLDLVASTRRLPAPGETVLGTGFAEHAGGKGLNQAIAAARAGATTAFIGAVGRDAAGDRLRDELVAASVDVEALARVDAPTGRALIVVDDDGENLIVVVPGANSTVAVARLPQARVVLVQLEIPIAAAAASLRNAKAQGAMTVLNPAPASGWTGELEADIVVPNEHEATQLGGAHAMFGRGASAVVTTLGSRGAAVVTGEGEWHQPAFSADVVDTTGAGDAFCGSLAARLAAGDELPSAVRFAAAAGALATTRHGAVPAMPGGDQIAALLTASA